MTFKIGDRVQIKKSSDFYKNQAFDNKGNKRKGAVTKYMGYYNVTFDDGYTNGYNYYDLEYTISFREKVEKLLEDEK